MGDAASFRTHHALQISKIKDDTMILFNVKKSKRKHIRRILDEAFRQMDQALTKKPYRDGNVIGVRLSDNKETVRLTDGCAEDSSKSLNKHDFTILINDLKKIRDQMAPTKSKHVPDIDEVNLMCNRHNITLQCMAGRNAHISNWYCEECDKEDTLSKS